MPFSAILLVFKFLMFSFLQVCKFTDLQVHNSINCQYSYGLSVKISDLLHLLNATKRPSRVCITGYYLASQYDENNTRISKRTFSGMLSRLNKPASQG